MTTATKQLFILLLIIKYFAGAENLHENTADIPENATQAINHETLETAQWEAAIAQTTTPQSSLNQELQNETSKNFADLGKQSLYKEEGPVSPAAVLAESELVRIILKDVLSSQEESKDAANNATKYFLKVTPKPLPSLDSSPNYKTSSTQEEEHKNFTETVMNKTIIVSVEQDLNKNPATTWETNVAESELINKQKELVKSSTQALKDNLGDDQLTETIVQNTTNLEVFEKNLTHSFDVVERTAAAGSKLTTNHSNSLKSNVAESELFVKASALEIASTPIRQEEWKWEKPETSTSQHKANCEFVESFENYAVKQTDFILNHLLTQTQVFVAKVLQATVVTVFPRDQLKRYAEDLNRLLNPDRENDYSAETPKAVKMPTQDEMYEGIVQKLNFLKRQPSRFLQSNLPQEWLHDYRQQKAELTIWLDKAIEQMHKEFNCYVTEEEDHIKYQYFKETFDDISRATEVHHKLAFLADLMKIVKNKKQITFMDLYMQT